MSSSHLNYVMSFTSHDSLKICISDHRTVYILSNILLSKQYSIWNSTYFVTFWSGFSLVSLRSPLTLLSISEICKHDIFLYKSYKINNKKKNLQSIKRMYGFFLTIEKKLMWQLLWVDMHIMLKLNDKMFSNSLKLKKPLIIMSGG